MSRREKTIRLSDAEFNLLGLVTAREYGTEDAVPYGFVVGELAVERMKEDVDDD